MIYDVQTKRFGVLQLEADSIKDARRRARAYGVDNPDATTLHRDYVHCSTCDSKPCVCAQETP